MNRSWCFSVVENIHFIFCTIFFLEKSRTFKPGQASTAQATSSFPPKQFQHRQMRPPTTTNLQQRPTLRQLTTRCCWTSWQSPSRSLAKGSPPLLLLRPLRLQQARVTGHRHCCLWVSSLLCSRNSQIHMHLVFPRDGVPTFSNGIRNGSSILFASFDTTLLK